MANIVKVHHAGEEYGIVGVGGVTEVANSGIDITNYTTYMSDTIHPNANGYALFSRELCKFCANGC